MTGEMRIEIVTERLNDEEHGKNFRKVSREKCLAQKLC